MRWPSLDRVTDVKLLFTDVVMPDINGKKLADEAVRRRPGLKVLFTTGYTANAVVHGGVLDSGVNFISKPFTLDQLAAKVRAVSRRVRRGIRPAAARRRAVVDGRRIGAGQKNLLQHFPFDRLLQDRNFAEPGVDAVGVVAGDKDERHAAPRQNFGDRGRPAPSPRLMSSTAASKWPSLAAANASDAVQTGPTTWKPNSVRHSWIIMATSASSSTRSTRGLLDRLQSDGGAVAARHCCAPCVNSRDFVDSLRGIEKSQRSPFGFQSNAALPPSCCSMLATMTFRPKLRADGVAIGGPPLSDPVQRQASRLQLPGQTDLALDRRQRAVLGRIGGELVQRQRQPLRGRRLQRNIRPVELDLVAGSVGREFLGDQRGEIGAMPARIGQQRVRARQRLDAALDRRDVIVDAFGARQPDDRLDDGERIAGAVIDLARQQDSAAPRLPCAR